jgi:hypothetical protein
MSLAPEHRGISRYVRTTGIGVACAILLMAIGFLPIVNWIPGGHGAPWYDVVVSGWLSGTAIVAGVGIVLAILSRRVSLLWRADSLTSITAAWDRRPTLGALGIATLALLLYAWVALSVHGGLPLHVDEIIQTLQAQIFTGGSLSRPTFAHPEFFSSIHVVDNGGRYYSQFPAGGPAMLALGVLLGAPWIIGPLCGAIGVFAFSMYMRATEERRGTALLATCIFALAPFAVFMSGSHMNHVPALMWTLIAVAALAGVMQAAHPRPALAALSGLGFGIAATIRPVDALAFALPAGVWYLVRALREPRRWADAIPAGVGVVLPMLALMWVNVHTTGAPLRFGYQVLWGKSHDLGFHTAPWGMAHTPARGLELVNLYFLRLQTYFLETPIPSLLPAIAALALARRLDRFDRYLLACSALLIGLYFAYWHDGFYLGPRFMYLLLIPLAIWTARLFPLLRDRVGSGLAYRATIYGAICAAAMAVALNVPLRARQYGGGMQTMRWDADGAATKAGVSNALVLVRESWGAQLVARLWALGVPRSETEFLYHRVDACALDHAVERLEQSSTRGMDAYRALRPLLADSARVVGSPFSPDASERYLPESRYSDRCLARINDDRAGFTLFTPLLLAHGGGNIYARDLHERDTLLLQAYPGRPVYLLRPASADIGEPPRFYPLSRDSLEQAWRGVVISLVQPHATAIKAGR